MIQDDAFGQLIRELKQEFDMVILDSPPGMVFPDALLLAQHADEVASGLPLQQGQQTQGQSVPGSTCARRRHLFLGVVFNGAPASGTSGTSYYDYKAYKEYEHR